MKNNKIITQLISIYIIIVVQFCSYSYADYKKGTGKMDKKYSHSNVLFSKEEIEKDANCYNAASQAARIFFYIDMIKDIYDDICLSDNIKCDKTKPPIPDLLNAIKGLEGAASNFEREVIGKSCTFVGSRRGGSD